MPKKASIADRTHRIINNLQVETHLSGRFKPASLSERMTRTDTPGASVTVLSGGKIAWSKGFGYKNLRTKEEVDHDTMFLAGSISKPVFALAVMKMVESGKVDLDRDVNEYLKRWKIPNNGGWQPKITMRQLLSHTAGLTVQGFPGYRQSADIPSTVQILRGIPPANTDQVLVNILPGTMMRYSGGGTTVAQLAVEDIYGKPFAEVMDEVLFLPLGLTTSTYRQTLSRKQKKQIAQGYPFCNREIEGGYHIYPEMAAAGLWTNGHDLAKLLIELQKSLGGERSFFPRRIVELMLTPQKVAKNMGLGFFLDGSGSSARFFHGGWDEGFVAKLVSYREGGNGAVVFLNSNGGYGVLEEILRAIAIEYEWKGYLPEEDVPAKLNAGVLHRYCGIYKSETGLNFSVEGGRRGIALVVEGQLPVELLPKSKTDFYSDKMNVLVTFEFNKKENVGRLSIMQGGVVIKAEKRAS